ncbi:DUF2971 domain-containing protein [Clostridium estertheticum]|uniref:DUF2971 domain-containing protein n=1 Tax=Clostridium estertheticum TaxID=238834 RepID=UPI001C0C5005|nr:DUF2971 domain-containing protein [Clostridium estertheticum]MBU3187672.1 DUF2971 domain-containing protein [Clostridium estertheticum]
MSFESFVDIIQRQVLTFVSPAEWEDPFESYLFKAVKNDEGTKKVMRILKEITPKYAQANMEILKRFEFCIKGQCWTNTGESDALWRIYSNNKMAIRIEVEEDKINRLNNVTINEVKYSNKLSLEAELQQMRVADTLDVRKAFCSKRSAFKHENEVRLLSGINVDAVLSDSIKMQKLSLEQLKKDGKINETQYTHILTKVINYQGEPKLNKTISFEHIDGFIKSVMLHPSAPKWFEDTLKFFCETHKLNYVGKSKLYELQFD